MAAMGFLVAVSGCMMSTLLEQDDEALINLPVKERVVSNLKQMWKAFQLKELQQAAMFFFLASCIVPSFGDFLYYYEINIAGFTKFQVALLSVFGYVALVVSTIMYNIFLKNFETRYLVLFASFVNVLGAVLTLCFVTGNTFGLSPMVFIVFTSTVFDIIYTALMYMPGLVIFAKLIPHNIEASMFALLMGLSNFSDFGAKMLGNGINYFVGVTNENLEDLWKLIVWDIVFSIVPMLLIWLVPKRDEVRSIQKVFDY